MKEIRDTEYFNGCVYSFVNKSMYGDLKQLSKIKKLPIFYQIDEAIRDYLSKELRKIYKKPKVPGLIVAESV